MADALTNVAALNNLLPDYYVPNLLLTLEAEAKLKEFAVKTPLPEHEGKQVFWNARRNFGGPSVALTEGSNGNDAAAISSRRVSATIDQYGRAIKLSDLSKLVLAFNSMSIAQDSIKESIMEGVEFVLHTGIFKAAYYGSQSKTVLLSSMMSSIASSFCANTGDSNVSNKRFQFPAVFGTSCARLSAVSKTAASPSAQLSVYSMRKATQRLRRLNAKPLADGHFVGYTHPNAIHTLKKDPTWREWNQYTNSKETMYKGEIGMIDNVRLIMSTLAPQYRVAAHSVNLVFIFGKEAFGLTELNGAIDQYVVGGPDSGNKFNLYGYVSFKYTAAAACLNPSAGVILFVHEVI